MGFGRVVSGADGYRRVMETLPLVVSVNVGPARPTEHSDVGFTGIDKRPSSGPVQVAVPGPGGSGLAGDVLCDTRFHGGVTQAVYAFAREDLDEWASALGRVLDNGVFGENLTTSGLDVTGAIVGERWRIGSALLEVTAPRIPCRTFAGVARRAGVDQDVHEAGGSRRLPAGGRAGAGPGRGLGHRARPARARGQRRRVVPRADDRAGPAAAAADGRITRWHGAETAGRRVRARLEHVSD